MKNIKLMKGKELALHVFHYLHDKKSLAYTASNLCSSSILA